MLALLSKAVLAAVVTHVPLNALISQTGFGGFEGMGGGGLVTTVAPVFLEQEKQKVAIIITIKNNWFERS
jgi:hypothetical protein